jgi:hypothetical protein
VFVDPPPPPQPPRKGKRKATTTGHLRKFFIVSSLGEMEVRVNAPVFSFIKGVGLSEFQENSSFLTVQFFLL